MYRGVTRSHRLAFTLIVYALQFNLIGFISGE